MERGFVPGFQTVTRPATSESTDGSCIDNIFIKTKNISTNTCKIEHLITDHFPLIITIKKVDKCNTWEEKTQRIDNKKVKILANKINWTEILSIQDPNQAVNALVNKINICIEQSMITKNNNKKTSKSKPRHLWITSAIINSCSKKEQLYNTWQLDRKNDNLITEYKKYEKVLNKVIKDAKYKYDRTEVEKCCSNTRELWKLINEKLGKKKNRTTRITQLIDSNNQIGEKIHNPKEIANAMNTYFGNIGTELSNKISRPTNDTVRMPKLNTMSIFLHPTNYSEIEKIIKDMALKSGSVDNINTKTIKILSKHIINVLVHIWVILP